jgi:hypothetical protein
VHDGAHQLKLAALVFAGVLASGCERAVPPAISPTPPASTVWWRETQRDVLLRGGGVATTPPGREETLLPSLYSAGRVWSQRCAAQPEHLPAREVRIEFDLQLNQAGKIVRARPRSALSLGVCLAEAMEATPAFTHRFASSTELVVQLQFERAPR